MRPISHILMSKLNASVHAVAPDSTVYDALKLMSDRNVGAVLVMQGEAIVGILSERDYARKIVLKDLSSRTTPVSEIMSSPVVFVTPQQNNEECMALMTSNRIRHLPVLDEGKLLGMISIGDLVKDVISELEFSNDQLVHYISGSHGSLGFSSHRIFQGNAG
mgnify:CR=1 FL=1